MSSVLKNVMATQAPPNPATEAIRIRYIDSLLTNVIAQLIGAMPAELQVSGDLGKIEEFIRAVRDAINAFLPSVFFLDFSEKHTNFALYMDMAVTVVKKMLHTGATAAQSITPIIVGLIPLPAVGTVGAIIGWLYSIALLSIAAAVGFVSRDFGYTAESLAGMIPVVGSTAMRIIHSGDETATRYVNKIYRMTGATQPVVDRPPTKVESVTSVKDALWPTPPPPPAPAPAAIE
jgi:hypothetical protein